MDLLKQVLNTLKKNSKFAVLLVLLAIIGGAIHYFKQSISYISNFKTNSGFVDYTLLKSLTDFKQVNEDVYDLPERKIDEINSNLENYRISFLEETSLSISFTVVTNIDNADHKMVQDQVLNLLNHNRFLKKSYQDDIIILEKKLVFLENKMALLDSLIVAPNEFTNVGDALRDSYDLYLEKLDLEVKIASIGKFDIIKPVTEVKTNKKPLILFLALYLVLGGFIFLVFCKKEETT